MPPPARPLLLAFQMPVLAIAWDAASHHVSGRVPKHGRRKESSGQRNDLSWPLLLVDRPITTQLKTSPPLHSQPRALPVCSGVCVACFGQVRGKSIQGRMHRASPHPAGGGATLPACATPRSQRARLLEGDGTSLDRLCETLRTGNILAWALFLLFS
jgi:hypothetical protein